ISFAFPGFYLAILLVLIFSYYFSVFPINGLHSQGVSKESFWLYYTDMLWHLALPIFVIVFGGYGSLTLYIRSLTKEIIKSDYYFFAKARGLSSKLIRRRYVYPNLAPPIITMLGLSLPALIGGSVILETIFAIDGMGLLFYNSALSRDYPVIMGILIIGAFLTLLGNIIADTVLLLLNPYFKKAKS
ncbi:MAG: ABC transporter permease, partial [Campylobacterales bacterium]